MCPKTERILVIDDQFELREFLSFTLKDRYDVATAGGAEDAYKYMDEHFVNLVLLDFKMPKIDGITALEEIKKRHPGTEVIMMTGYAPVDTIQKAFDLGAFAFFMKPFDMNKLLIALDEALQKNMGDILNPADTLYPTSTFNHCTQRNSRSRRRS